MKKFILSLGLAMLTTFPAMAQYGVLATLWSADSITNIPATASNVAAVVGVTRWAEFSLDVQTFCTNNSGGWLDLAYCVSNDETNFCDSPDTTLIPGKSGVISVPLTNTGVSTIWTTNVTVGSFGYWKLNWVTNNSTCHFTNILIRAYVKPRRNG